MKITSGAISTTGTARRELLLDDKIVLLQLVAGQSRATNWNEVDF